MEKLRNLLLYGGAMPDVYRNCRDEIRKENLEKLFFFLTVEIVFLLIALAVCCAVKSLAGGFIAYIIALACALALLCTVQSCQNSNIVLSICADSFLGICYLLSLYLGCFAYPDEPAICFHVVAVVLPMLFTRPAIGNILRTVIYEALFIGCSVTFKDPALVPRDVFNAVLFGLMGCVLSTYYIRVLTDNVVARCKLKVIAETDLNTQIPNRNAYENHMNEYPLRCSNTLSCVYVDVNGLHELNNTKGHDAGDVMLKTVAQEMVRQFGIKDSYRMGAEIEAGWSPLSFLTLEGNAALSRNRIKDFDEMASVDWESSFRKIHYSSSTLAFSPSAILNGFATFHYQGAQLIWHTNFVSRQYLDNTENNVRSLPCYSQTNIHANYTFRPGKRFAGLREVVVGCDFNNIFNRHYAASGRSSTTTAIPTTTATRRSAGFRWLDSTLWATSR